MMGNLIGALTFKPGIIYIFNRTHGLHFFKVGLVPGLLWHNLFRLLLSR